MTWEETKTADCKVSVTKHPDGWYYTNTGYRFHATSESGYFKEVWDLERTPHDS